jgi:Ca-activated chloride channel family protein
MRKNLFRPSVLLGVALIAVLAACSRAPEPAANTSVACKASSPSPEFSREYAAGDELVFLPSSDDYNEDPSEGPTCAADFPDYSSSDSPNPNRGPSSATGMGGGAGGGGGRGRGGAGGVAYRRVSANGAGGRESRPVVLISWARDFQNTEGYWSADKFRADSARKNAKETFNLEFREPGKATGDQGQEGATIGVTALTLLTFAGMGEDHKQGAYKDNCRRAIMALRKMQKNDGSFGESGDAIGASNQPLCVMALAEMYCLSGDVALRANVERGVEYLLGKQLKGSGWAMPENPRIADVSLTGWTALALHSAKLSGIEFDRARVFGDVAKWIRATDPYLAGKTGLWGRERKSGAPLFEAVALTCGLIAGLEPADVLMSSYAATVTAKSARWEAGKVDFESWYFGARGLWQAGTQYSKWGIELSELLRANRRGERPEDKGLARESLAEYGSWDAVDSSSVVGGRVYATAMATLALEVADCSRHAASHTKKDSDKDGIIDLPEGILAGQTASETRACPSLQARKEGASVGEFPLQRTDVKAEVSGWLASTRVSQTYTNPYKENIEAVYVFPLPGDAAINGFLMEVGSRRIHGIIRPREEATRMYKEARARGQTASLMTQERSDVFTQNVANIEPAGQVKISITYFQTLKYDSGYYEYVFPTVVSERFNSGEPTDPKPDAEPVGGEGERRNTDKTPDAGKVSPPRLPEGKKSGATFALTLDLDAGMPIGVTKCVNHNATILQVNEKHIVVKVDDGSRANREFVFRWSIAGNVPQAGLLAHRDQRGGFFTLMLQPQLDPRDSDVTPREITFIMDTSGSMAGQPVELCKNICNRVIDTLRPDDIFNIVFFAGGNSQLFERPMPRTPENIEKAKSAVLSQRGEGGTEMLSGLQRALGAEHDARFLQMYVFLTDGEISNENEILQTIRDKGQKARFFAFGTGNSVNRALLDGIGKEGHGKTIYCLPREVNDSTLAVREFYESIDSPVLCDISLDWGNLPVSDVSPQNVTDLFKGKPILLRGKYSTAAKGTLHVRGRVGGRLVDIEVAVDLPEQNKEHECLGALWAKERVSELLAQLQNDPGNPAFKDEVIKLGVDFNLLTPFTGFIAIDESRISGDGKPLRVMQPVEQIDGRDLPKTGKRVVSSDDGALYSAMEVKAWGLTVFENESGDVEAASVKAGSAAEKAGITPGSLVKAVNNVKVVSMRQMEAALLQSVGEVEVRFAAGETESKVTLPKP